MQWPLVEVDVSGQTDPARTKQMLGATPSMGGLFSNRRLYFVDEVDGAVARGQMPVIAELARENKQPLIFAVNDAWESKLSPIRALCKLVEFKGVNTTTVVKVLSALDSKQTAAGGAPVAQELQLEIAQKCGGDLRAAINDMQAGSAGLRDTRADIFRTVAKILKAPTVQDALAAGDSAEVDLPMLIKWVEENVSEEYEDPLEVAQAFNWLSRADVFSGRITRRQQWGLLAYVRFLALAGVSSSKKAPYSKFTRYKFPTYIKALSVTRARRQALVSAGTKVGGFLHCSHQAGLESLILLYGSKGLQEKFGLTLEEAEEASSFVAVAKTTGAKPKVIPVSKAVKPPVGKQSLLG
jgi:replication factor C large subunit